MMQTIEANWVALAVAVLAVVLIGWLLLTLILPLWWLLSKSFQNQNGEFIDLCADNGLTGAELTSYYWPKDVNDDELLRVRRYAFLRGISISGTSVGNTFALPDGPTTSARPSATSRTGSEHR